MTDAQMDEWIEETEEVSSDAEERGFEACRIAALAMCRDIAMTAACSGLDPKPALDCVAKLRKLQMDNGTKPGVGSQ